MYISLDYGKRKLNIDIDDKNILHVIENKKTRPVANQKPD